MTLEEQIRNILEHDENDYGFNKVKECTNAAKVYGIEQKIFMCEKIKEIFSANSSRDTWYYNKILDAVIRELNDKLITQLKGVQ